MTDNQQQVGYHYSGVPGPFYNPYTVPTYFPNDLRQQQPSQGQGGTQAGQQGMLPMQQSYIENILRLNRGKLATIYMTFEGRNGGNTKVFKGIIEAAGRDHIIISDPETGRRYLLLMVYLDYVTFDEEINYSYPFQGQNQLSNYEPR